MAYGTFSIGSFDFAGMAGTFTLAAPVNRLRVERRLGVDGVQITSLGREGQTSRLRTWRDLATWQDGFSLFEDYRELVGSGAQSITINSVPMASFGYRVMVMDVQRREHFKSSLIVGNTLEENPTAVLECDWTLLPVALV